jgi:hypothetical protein
VDRGEQSDLRSDRFIPRFPLDRRLVEQQNGVGRFRELNPYSLVIHPVVYLLFD